MGFLLRVAHGRTAPPVCYGANRKTASLSVVRSAAGMLWCTPENHVSLSDTLIASLFVQSLRCAPISVKYLAALDAQNELEGRTLCARSSID